MPTKKEWDLLYEQTEQLWHQIKEQSLNPQWDKKHHRSLQRVTKLLTDVVFDMWNVDYREDTLIAIKEEGDDAA